MSGDCTSCSPSPTDPPLLRVAVLGVCGSGKSTLARSLREHGYDARQISQEHSGVRRLWRHSFAPDLLIYLCASVEAVEQRLGSVLYGDTYNRQLQRLAVARDEADIIVDTDTLSPQEVLERVLKDLPRPSSR